MKKSELRKRYTAKKNSLSHDEVFAMSKIIFTNFLSFFPLKKNQKIHCFLSISGKNEVETGLFLQAFFDIGIRVFVPKIVNGKLVSVEIKRKTPLIKNSWGIPEPESNTDSGIQDFDYVITPLLYCDAKGNRVGYGKGFYDRFFSGLSDGVKRIGVGLFDPAEKVTDVSEHDIPLHYLVTPTAVLSFGGESKSTK
ncbi:5-formyltetrahydrofolate cyclo-ligase [Kaistella palustris]|uniref:5-formyltetrahydrofolate cyclo-ligase n=1 Tax=Kaistella palustris TaxID=493376 RepID=UPI000480EC61|nr:5-formyltetrahydrofolate cyclo-ligase [Kaistella palustris]